MRDLPASDAAGIMALFIWSQGTYCGMNTSSPLPPPFTAHSQQCLECEHAQLVFGEGGARAVSYPVRKLCALLSLPQLASLQPRLVTHVGILVPLWLPRDLSVLVEFFQDTVELLQVCDIIGC